MTQATDLTDQYLTTVSAAPINYLTSEGWEPIDSSLTVQPDGGWRSGPNSFHVNIWSTTEQPKVRLDFDGHHSVGWSIGTATRSDSAAGGGSTSDTAPRSAGRQVSDREVQFEQILPGVDVKLASESTGIKETLTLASPDVPDTYRFPLQLAGTTVSLTRDGEVAVHDLAGGRLGLIPRGWMMDSAPGEVVAAAPNDAVTYSLEGSLSAPVLVMTLDRSWLDDPARVYPVTVDPSLQSQSSVGNDASGHDDSRIVALATNDHTEEPLQVGRDVLYQKSLLFFDLAGIDPAGTRVIAAQLKLHVNSGGSTCGPSNRVKVAPVTGPAWYSSPNTWPVWPGPTVGSDVDASQSCPGADSSLYLSSDDYLKSGTLTALVQGWISVPSSNNGVELRADTYTSTMALDLRMASAEDVSGDAPVLEFFTEALRGPNYLQVNGWDAQPSASTHVPLTYTNLPSGQDCYPERSTGYVPTWWAPSKECRVDLYWKGAPVANQPTVVLVHGGGWMAMDNLGYGRRVQNETMRYADALAERGYLVAVIDYRQDLYGFRASHSNWQTDSEALVNLALWFHCTQRFEKDGTTPKTWPPPPTLTPDPGQPSLPQECATLQGDYADLMSAMASSAASHAVADIQAAVSWLRTDPTGFLGGRGVHPGKVFLLGASAGATSVVKANYDPASTAANHANVDGSIALAGGFMPDVRALADTAGLLPAVGANAAAPLQIQQSEYDLSAPIVPGGTNTDRFLAGDYDFGRQTSSALRGKGYKVELRTRAGNGHTPDPSHTSAFNPAIGEALAFLDGLSVGRAPANSFWFGSDTLGDFYPSAPSVIGQDLMETSSNLHRNRVGDFNGDDLDDVLWWQPGGDSTVWYAQGDGSFARSDMSYPVPGDSASTRIVTDVFDNPAVVKVSAAEALKGDFNGDGVDDIYWYVAGSPADELWLGGGDPYAIDVARTGTFTAVSVSVSSASCTKLVVGDLDGDLADDIYCYRVAGNDEVWTGLGSSPYFVRSTITSSPDGFTDVVVGNFNGDLRSGHDIDDVVFVGASAWTARFGTASPGVLSTPSLWTSSAPAHTQVLAGNWNRSDQVDGVKRDDLFLFNGPSSVSTVWYGTSTAGTFSPYTQSAGPSGAQVLATGNFDGDGQDDVLFRDPGSGSETLYRGKGDFFNAHTGFLNKGLGNPIANDRMPIVGQFGVPEGSSETRDHDDVIWHLVSDRSDPGPSGGWYWPQTTP